MLYRLKKLANSFYFWWLRVTRLDKNMTVRHLDFERKWWSIITERWLYWCTVLSGRIIATAFLTLVPVLIGFIFRSQHSVHFFYLVLAWVVVELWRYITIWMFDTEQASIAYGVQYSSYRFFLTVDPIYHAMRTSGRLFAKIERGARAYENLLNTAIYELLPIFVGVFTVIISFFTLDIVVGMIALVFLLLILFLNVSTILFNALAFELRLIDADDDVKVLNMESLTQIELVRSSFASDELDHVVHKKNRHSAAVLSGAWISFATAMLFTRILYGVSVAILGVYVLFMVTQGRIDSLVGASFLATYLHGSYKVMRIGHRAQKLMRYLIRIKDLFSFIQGFGLQTFPVLAQDAPEIELPKTEKITIQALDLHFYYTKKAQIFEDHSLSLVIPRSQESKLYGIIGPSGAGKTTLISILGGQLRPTTGDVAINGVSMYEITDDDRRQLVAMQGQTASNMSGTVRDSLLLGLPKDHELFPDDILINMLKRVGVWMIFEQKEGLESAVGEGGMNLSVGQRQRLNFASLYLRTNYFKPSLILIDEPTSSLDEVSEQAITDMIDELARYAITFVIAHRLHTLEKAVGILDVSLVAHEKNLIFYSRDQLMKKSDYYKKLLRGEVAIEG